MTVADGLPDELAGELARGEQLLDLGRYADAHAVAQAMLTVEPDDPDALALFVQACLGLRDRAALPAARSLLALVPDRPVPLMLAARAAAVQRQSVSARRYADAAVALDPDSCGTHHNRAWIELLGPSTKAGLAAARTAVRLGPDDPDSHRLLGALLLKRGRLDDAEASLRAALALDPSHEAALDDLGRLGLERLQPIEAARRFAARLALDPSDERTAHNTMVALGRPVGTVHTVLLLAALWLWLDLGSVSNTLAAYFGMVGVMIVAASMARSMVARLPTSGGRLFATTLRRDRLLVALGLVLAAAYAVLYAVPVAPDLVVDDVTSAYLWLTLAAATALRVLRVLLGRSRARPVS